MTQNAGGAETHQDDGAEQRGWCCVLSAGGAAVVVVVVCWRRGGGVWAVGALLRRRRRCAGARWLLALRWDEDRAEARTATAISHSTRRCATPAPAELRPRISPCRDDSIGKSRKAAPRHWTTAGSAIAEAKHRNALRQS